MPLLSVEEICSTVDRALRRAGVPAAHAVIQRDALLEAELRGISSHGLLRLPLLIARITKGLSDPDAVGRHVWRSPGFLAVDGERGLGPVVALAALDAAAARARTQGVCVVAVHNSNHLGMLANYAERIATSGQTIIAFSISEALVHPWGGYTPLIGTNPISIGVPTEDGPFVVDAATSIVSMGRIHDRANRGEEIPANWALDTQGRATTDPNRAKSGALSPFGEAKGYALGLAFELLVASLTGAALGPDVHGTLDATDVCNKGDLFIVIDGPRAALGAYLNLIRSAPPAPGFERIVIPGERGRECKRQRLKAGVPVADAVWSQVLDLGGAPSTTTIEKHRAAR